MLVQTLVPHCRPVPITLLRPRVFSTHESWLFVYIFLMKLITPVRARFFDAMVERDGADSEAGNMKIGTTTASLSS